LVRLRRGLILVVISPTRMPSTALVTDAYLALHASFGAANRER